MEIFNAIPGYHVWAEVFIPGYGWIPVDPAIGHMQPYENVTPGQRDQYNRYFFGSQDPFRYYIQKDSDSPVIPDPGNLWYYHMFHQGPMADGNRSILCNDYLPNWTVNITRAEKNGSLR